MKRPGSYGFPDPRQREEPIGRLRLEPAAAPPQQNPKTRLAKAGNGRTRRELLGSNPVPYQIYPSINCSSMLGQQRGLGLRLATIQRTLLSSLFQDGQDAAERLSDVPLPAKVQQQAMALVDPPRS